MEENPQTGIYLTTGTIVRVLLFLLLFYILYLLLDIVLVVLTAVVIASAIEPATRWFGRYKVPRIPAVIIIYLLVTFAIVGIFYFFIPPLLDDAAQFARVLPDYVESFTIPDQFSNAGNIVGDISRTISLEQLITQAKAAVSGLSGGVFEAINLVFGGAMSFFLIIVISFYLGVQENGISNFLKLVTPIKHQEYIINLWTRSQTKIGRWFQGQMLLGLIIGVLVYLGLTVLQVPHALLLAIVAAVFEIIPVFGPILASIPAIILGFVEGGLGLGAMTIGLYLIIQQFENHLIYPLVVRKVVGVPPLLVILALIVGAKLVGFLGIILSVPLAAALVEFTNDIAKEKRLWGDK